MPFLWKCYIWVVVGVVGYIVGAARWALDKNRDKPRICFPSLRLALHSYKALRE